MDRELVGEWPLLALIVAIVVGVGWLVSALVVAPEATWAAALTLPFFVIPEPVSPLLSLFLSVAFAIVGWRIWLSSGRIAVDMGLWSGVLVLGWLFTPSFIVVRAFSVALGIAVVIAVLMIALTVRLVRHDRTAAFFAMPCALYLVYVAALTNWVIVINQL